MMYDQYNILLKFYVITLCRPISPKYLAFSREGISTPIKTWLLGLTRHITPNGISIKSVVFLEFTVITNGQTDRTATELDQYNRPLSQSINIHIHITGKVPKVVERI